MFRKTIARHKGKIAKMLNELPEIFKSIGIDCNISVDTNGKFLSVTICVKTENMPEWITIVRDFEDRTPLVECWRRLTAELVTAFICMSKALLSATVNTAANVDYFTLGIYCANGEKAISWVVCPKPDCIEVEENGMKREVLSWEEYIRKLAYTIRLIMEVGEDV